VAAVVETGQLQREAAQGLYERFYPSVYRYALSQVRSPEDAEDATQNTFLRAFAALQRGVVPENEAAWLFKIAHNVCVSSKLAWLRRRRVETPRDLDELPGTPAAPELRSDELFGLDDALAAMPARLREAFLLREWQGLSYQEIADRLDTSRSAVETLIFRARRTLAAQLETPVRRVRQALGVGPLLAALRGLAGGGSLAVKAAAVAVVAAGAGIAAQPLLHSAPAVHHPAVAPVAVHAGDGSVAGTGTPAAPRRSIVARMHAGTPAVQARLQAPVAPEDTPLPVPATPAGALDPVNAPFLPTPATSLPAAPAPAATVPPATAPAVPAPTAAVPAAPAVTTPAVTTPAVTVPAATIPAVTVPAVTVPQLPLP
jgi:RNA polymerase sigma-70 factor (ECF subfamily)